MNERQSKIFKIIVKEYIKNAAPISSAKVLNKSDLDISSATVRNIMANLEKDGLITQPHTSAGRIPTQKGYQLYIDQFLGQTRLSQKFIKEFESILEALSLEQQIRTFAKGIAELSNLFVFVAFDPRDIYYTGLSNLLAHPEFCEFERYYDIARVIDHMDEVIFSIFDQIDDNVHTFIGDQNPFGKECSSIISPYNSQDKEGMMGIIGPMRMDYDTNIALMKYAQQRLA